MHLLVCDKWKDNIKENFLIESSYNPVKITIPSGSKPKANSCWFAAPSGNVLYRDSRLIFFSWLLPREKLSFHLTALNCAGNRKQSDTFMFFCFSLADKALNCFSLLRRFSARLGSHCVVLTWALS